jgi:hypothetical protein
MPIAPARPGYVDDSPGMIACTGGGEEKIALGVLALVTRGSS